MKVLNFTMFVLFFSAYIYTSYSQEVTYSALFKNVNKTAKSLSHHLNTAGDTLFLESEFNLNKIEIIGNTKLKEYALKDSFKKLRIPLNDLPPGDYTIAVVHTEGHDDTYIYRKTIVFKISRILPIGLDSNKGLNNLASNMNFGNSQIPILDLSENRIIKDIPNSDNLAANNIDEVNVLGSKEIVSNSGNIVLNEIIKDEPMKLKAYNLTDIRHRKNRKIQSRAEYRRNNLRPNGKRYD